MSSRFTSSALGEKREKLSRLRSLHSRALLCLFSNKRKTDKLDKRQNAQEEECKFGKIKIQYTNSANSDHKNHSDNFTSSQVRLLNPSMSFEATVPKAGRAIPSPAVLVSLQPQSWDAQGCKAELWTQTSQTTSPGAAGYRNPAHPFPNFLVDVANKELDQAGGRSCCVPQRVLTRAWEHPLCPKQGPVPSQGQEFQWELPGRKGSTLRMCCEYLRWFEQGRAPALGCLAAP